MVVVSVALVGLVDAFRTSTEVYHANAVRSRAWMLLEGKLADLEDAGMFREGEESRVFAEEDDFNWSTVTTGTALASLWRVEIEVTGRGESVRAVAYLRTKEEGG